MILLLEESLDKPTKDEYKKYFSESIKCHHNDIANNFQDFLKIIKKIICMMLSFRVLNIIISLLFLVS